MFSLGSAGLTQAYSYLCGQLPAQLLAQLEAG